MAARVTCAQENQGEGETETKAILEISKARLTSEAVRKNRPRRFCLR